MEATGSACTKKWLDCCHLSMPFQPAVCAGPARVQRALHIVARPDSQFMYTCVIFGDILWPEVQSQSDAGRRNRGYSRQL